jgi:uncharacterized protein YfaT (DUF1175 family)
MRLPSYATPGLLLVAALASAACQRAETAVRARVRAEASVEARAAAPPADGAHWADSDGDGIPDRAELHTFNDRESFRHWFTAVAESQFDFLSEAWSAEQRDCAGLVRFAWREALRRHDRAWLQRFGKQYQFDAARPDVRAYDLERGPLGERIFRTRPGPFGAADLREGVFSEFADARTLKDYNSEFVSRDRRRAARGDLLFFHQPWVQEYPYHVMLFLGRSHRAGEEGDDWVVYHTGSTADGPGEVRQMRLSTLDRHPDPRWRPLAANRHFLGFYRLKILQ